MMDRRTFLKRFFQLGMLGSLQLAYAWQIEPFRLEFVQRVLPINNLPSHLEGAKLMQISDLHVGDRFDWNFIIDSFDKAKKFAPEFVVYTGDFVSWKSEKQLVQLETVMNYAVKGSLGTFGILGNHDYGENWIQPGVADSICHLLEKAGLQMLRNEQVETSGLNIIGFEDLWSDCFNPSLVMDHYDPDKANLVLCHNPDVCDLDVWNGYQGWILSGHTHGGQCKIPGFRAPFLPVKNKRYEKGAVDLGDGRHVYINRALGHSYQVRFNVRPEITIFTLKAI